MWMLVFLRRVYLCLYVFSQRSEEGVRSQVLELQALMNCLMLTLQTEFGSLAEVVFVALVSSLQPHHSHLQEDLVH